MKYNIYYDLNGHLLVQHTQICRRTKILSTFRHFFYFIRNIYDKISLIMLPKPVYNKKYNLTICAIFKNEGRFLKEWIEYYKILGVEHFYLYNNNSNDNFEQILHPYIERKIVTLIDWPVVPAQCAAYENWEKEYSKETQWNAFIDLDEFICPKQDITLLEWIKKHDKYPVRQIYWKMFGSSGIMSHQNDKTVIEQYTKAWPYYSNLGKCIYNTDFKINTFDNSVVHTLSVRYKNRVIYPMNPDGKFLYKGMQYGNVTSEDIQINHYWSRAYDIMMQKFSKGSIASKNSWRDTLDIDEKVKIGLAKEANCTIQDLTIQRFLLNLKINLGMYE